MFFPFILVCHCFCFGCFSVDAWPTSEGSPPTVNTDQPLTQWNGKRSFAVGATSSSSIPKHRSVREAIHTMRNTWNPQENSIIQKERVACHNGVKGKEVVNTMGTLPSKSGQRTLSDRTIEKVLDICSNMNVDTPFLSSISERPFYSQQRGMNLQMTDELMNCLKTLKALEETSQSSGNYYQQQVYQSQFMAVEVYMESLWPNGKVHVAEIENYLSEAEIYKKLQLLFPEFISFHSMESNRCDLSFDYETYLPIPKKRKTKTEREQKIYSDVKEAYWSVRNKWETSSNPYDYFMDAVKETYIQSLYTDFASTTPLFGKTNEKSSIDLLQFILSDSRADAENAMKKMYNEMYGKYLKPYAKALFNACGITKRSIERGKSSNNAYTKEETLILHSHSSLYEKMFYRLQTTIRHGEKHYIEVMKEIQDGQNLDFKSKTIRKKISCLTNVRSYMFQAFFTRRVLKRTVDNLQKCFLHKTADSSSKKWQPLHELDTSDQRITQPNGNAGVSIDATSSKRQRIGDAVHTMPNTWHPQADDITERQDMSNESPEEIFELTGNGNLRINAMHGDNKRKRPSNVLSDTPIILHAQPYSITAAHDQAKVLLDSTIAPYQRNSANKGKQIADEIDSIALKSVPWTASETVKEKISYICTEMRIKLDIDNMEQLKQCYERSLAVSKALEDTDAYVPKLVFALFGSAVKLYIDSVDPTINFVDGELLEKQLSTIDNYKKYRSIWHMLEAKGITKWKEFHWDVPTDHGRFLIHSALFVPMKEENRLLSFDFGCKAYGVKEMEASTNLPYENAYGWVRQHSQLSYDSADYFLQAAKETLLIHLHVNFQSQNEWWEKETEDKKNLMKMILRNDPTEAQAVMKQMYVLFHKTFKGQQRYMNSMCADMKKKLIKVLPKDDPSISQTLSQSSIQSNRPATLFYTLQTCFHHADLYHSLLKTKLVERMDYRMNQLKEGLMYLTLYRLYFFQTYFHLPPLPQESVFYLESKTYVRQRRSNSATHANTNVL